MITNDKFSKACNEVLEILKNVELDDYNKIPKKFLDNLQKNADLNYKNNIDINKNFEEQKLLPETIDLLAYIYRKYWCNEEEKKVFDKAIQENEIRYQEDLKNKYDIDNIFKNKEIDLNQSEKEKGLIISNNKKNIFKRILDFIKGKIN